jgi:predicted SAM-dependent methyltransferase
LNLHLGGRVRKDGWSVLDVQPGPHVDFVGDLRDLSQFGDGSVANVYGSHVLEHVDQNEIPAVLKGVHRIISGGGKFLISVPDLDALCHLFISPWATMEVKFHAMRMMFGGQIDPHDFHYIGLNEQLLRHFLGQAGFSEVLRVASFGLFEDTSDYKPYGFPISVNVIAIK